jgi:G3E family GTPase
MTHHSRCCAGAVGQAPTDTAQVAWPSPIALRSAVLWPQSQRRSEFDQVVIETTGLANPAPIIQTFFLDPDMSEMVRLDGVVTLVDAKHISRHLDEKKPDGVVNEAMEQIAYADRIVLNKIDLVSKQVAYADRIVLNKIDLVSKQVAYADRWHDEVATG